MNRGEFVTRVARRAWLPTILSALLPAMAPAALGAGPPKGLELRRIEKGRPEKSGREIPREAIKVFVYEGAPGSINVTDLHIALGYRRSGVVFDRKTGRLLRRYTLLDGWPKLRPRAFGHVRRAARRGTMVGPGVLDSRLGYDDILKKRKGEKIADKRRPVVSASFAGRTWTAYQPAGFLQGLDLWRRGKRKHDWSGILSKLDSGSYVESVAPPAASRRGRKKTVRYTESDGLAGNIVTHLVPHGGKLYAASVDIYDPLLKKWRTGGLSAYDPKPGRWRKIRGIAGRPVRFVTLLKTIGEDLWVGFREGSGATGRRIILGMGLYPGDYRPEATRLVLARLRDGELKTWWRFPGADPGTETMPAAKRPPPSEKPVDLAASGQSVILWSLTRSFRRPSGNWRTPRDGRLSMLDTATGKWKHFDLTRDFAADCLSAFHSDKGEVLVTSNHGAHRWDANAGKWNLLRTGSTLRNPSVYYAIRAGDEVWIGYNMKSFSVYGRQGISRYSEKTGSWSHFTPKEIGTASPVLQMALGPRGTVWVLFRKRFWGGAAAEFAFYPSEQQLRRDRGLGRFTNGKWEFPAKLEGVPTEVERTHQSAQRLTRWKSKAPVLGLAVVGKRVFVANAAGVYVGPGRWKRICEGPVSGIAPSEDGKKLIVAPHERGRKPKLTAEARRCGTDITVEKSPTFGPYARFKTATFLDRFKERKNWPRAWVPFPTEDRITWGLGPLEEYHYRGELVTPRAIWFASDGVLVRFDRARIAELLEQ